MTSNEGEKNGLDQEAYYEIVASQEEIFLEESEEEVRAILISENPRGSQATKTALSAPQSTCEQLNHAAEDLITGDSDDPPLSEETVSEMLRAALNPRRTA